MVFMMKKIVTGFLNLLCLITLAACQPKTAQQVFQKPHHQVKAKQVNLALVSQSLLLLPQAKVQLKRVAKNHRKLNFFKAEIIASLLEIGRIR